MIVEPAPLRPEGVTVLGGLALLAGIMLLVAGITFLIPFPLRWDYGPALIGFFIVGAFGYAGFGQFLPTTFGYVGDGQFFPMTWFVMIVILATLYLAVGIGFFAGRRWAWTLGIALALFGGASSILQTITWNQFGYGLYGLDAVPGLVVTVLILVYLTRPLARNFFFKRRQSVYTP